MTIDWPLFVGRLVLAAAVTMIALAVLAMSVVVVVVCLSVFEGERDDAELPGVYRDGAAQCCCFCDCEED